MYKRMIIGAAALALLAGVALAAQDGTNSTPSQDDNQIADNGAPPSTAQGDGQDEGGGWRHWRGHGRHGHRHGMMGPDGGRGGPDGRGPMMGMMMHMKGFQMSLGHGVRVSVACGEEAMKDCLASAQPLIDAAKTAAAAEPAAATKTP